MADVNLPALPSLSDMQFLDPRFIQQANTQMDLGNQFAQQNLASGAQDLQTKTLNNLFQQQNDPIKLQQNQGTADTTTAEAILKQIDAQQRQTLAPDELDAKRSAFVKQLSDDKLSKALSDAQQMMLSDDPATAAKGQDLYMRSAKEQSARASAKDQLTKQESENASRERIGAGNNAAQVQSSTIMAQGRVNAAQVRAQRDGSLTSDLAKAGTPDRAANVYDAYSQKAQLDGDTETANYYASMRDYNTALAQRNKLMAGDATRAANPNLGALGVPTNGSQLPPMPPMPQRPASLGQPSTAAPVNRGDPAAGSGLPPVSADDPNEGVRRTAKDLQDAIAAKATLPTNQAGALDAHIKTLQADLGRYQQLAGMSPQAQPARTAPAAASPTAAQPQVLPNGRVVIYKDGKGFSVPAAQAQDAVKQGYSLTK